MGDVVRGTGGKHRHRNAASGHPASYAPDRPVAAGDNDQLCALLERALPPRLLCRAVSHLVAGAAQELAQALAVLVFVPRSGVMDQRNKHAISWSNLICAS